MPGPLINCEPARLSNSLRHLFLLWFMVTAISATLAPTMALAAQAIPTGEWNGQYFDKKEGGLYLKVDLKDFKASAQTSYLTGDIKIYAQNVISRKLYVISVAPAFIDGHPRHIWQLPSGKYRINSVQMVDAKGVLRAWMPTKSKSLVIKRQCLSNLGLWTITPKAKKDLAINFKMVPNSYTESGPKSESSVAVVINGFNGLIQEVFGGKDVIEAAKNDYATDDQMRAVVRITRQIAMYYKLDLFKHNYYARDVAEVLAVYDPNMRTCYMNQLEYNDRLRGNVVFRFLLSKSTGTMRKLKVGGGSLRDPKMVRCLTLELGHMQFPAETNMIGELTYTFDVK